MFSELIWSKTAGLVEVVGLGIVGAMVERLVVVFGIGVVGAVVDGLVVVATLTVMNMKSKYFHDHFITGKLRF